MNHLGNIPANLTLYVPFATYGKTDGQSITLTGLAVTDIEIYKNGSATQRASDAGYTLLDTDGIDFDGITGIHGFSIDLSDNTDSGFYSAGAFYWVIVSAVTIDSQTVNFIAATFRIVAAEAVAGIPQTDVGAISGSAAAAANAKKYFDGTGYGAILVRTTIATLTNQGEFTLTAGSADDDAYNSRLVVIEDSSTAAQKAIATVSDYVGSTRTVTLTGSQHAFTIATGDIVTILAQKELQTTSSGYAQVDVQFWRGDSVPPPNTAGVPKVDATLIEGLDATDQLDASGGGGDEQAIAAAVASILAANTRVTIIAAVSGDNVTLKRGDTYSTASGQPLVFTKSGAQWPTDLTGWTITMVAYQTRGADGDPPATPDSLASTAGTIVQATGADARVQVDLTAAATGGLDPGLYDYYVSATHVTHGTNKLRHGVMRVLDDNPNA